MKSLRKLMTTLATGSMGFWSFFPEEDEKGDPGYFAKADRSQL